MREAKGRAVADREEMAQELRTTQGLLDTTREELERQSAAATRLRASLGRLAGEGQGGEEGAVGSPEGGLTEAERALEQIRGQKVALGRTVAVEQAVSSRTMRELARHEAEARERAREADRGA